MKKIIVIVGPTGIGKTKLSLKLAKQLNGEIINADAMQVYKKMDIGTAKIREEERENIPHHLLDICDVTTDYSVYHYQKDARKKIEEIQNRGKTVIIVGGTGLYIKATLYDYRFEKEEKQYSFAHFTNDQIYQELLSYDKNIKIDQNNRQRLERALFYYYQHHTSISSNKNGDNLLYDAIFIGLTTQRDKLYQCINQRVEEMIQNGLIEEVKSFYDQKIFSKPLKTGIGYKEWYPYFEGNATLEEVKEEIQKNSRHYAKRQYTFFKNQFHLKWFSVHFEDFDKTVEEVSTYIKNESN